MIVLERVINWLVQCLNSGVPQVVTRKLCSTLVVYFMHFSSTWTNCIKHLLCCLKADQFIPQEALSQAPPTLNMLEDMSSSKVVAALWFAISLVEEVGKTDSSNIKQ
jgi:hypothetical protein